MIALRHRRISATWLLFIAAGVLLLITLAARLPHQAYATNQAVTNGGEHIMTVYDDGQKKGFLTRANTLKDALDQAGFTLSANDKTDPALDTKLVAASYSVTVYRARPVLVIDGSSRTKVMTAYHTGKQIAEQAGIKLHDEDTADLENSTDVVADGALEKMVVTRATPFKLVLYGESSQAYTQSKTVGDMLAEKGVKLASKDKVSPSLDTVIKTNMKVEIWREGVQTVTRKEVAHYSVRQISDANQPVGYKKIKTPGVNGKKTVTYEITVKNGKEVKKKVIQSVITKKAIEQVEVIGTKANLPAGSHADWMEAAGIAPSDYGYVEYIVMREGGWEPCKVQGGAINCLFNANLMVGYGIVQATPGIKMASAGSDWRTNPITQLRWATGYAVGRYGSWQAAYDHWRVYNNW